MFLFTDIEDSTRLWQSAPEVMQVALARHDAIMRDGIASHGGEVFKTAGDAFYAAFPDPVRGLDAALALQRALGDQPWPAATPLRVRMALHVGEAQARDGDWFGPPLNVVARMLTVARGAQTLVSAAAASFLEGSATGAAGLESHGHYRLKASRSREVFELGLRGSRPFAPPPETSRSTASSAGATSGNRCARYATTWLPSATPSSAARPSCTRSRSASTAAPGC